MSALTHRRVENCVRTPITPDGILEIVSFIETSRQLSNAFQYLEKYMELNSQTMTPVLWAMAINLMHLKNNQRGQDAFPICEFVDPNLLCSRTPYQGCEYFLKTVCCVMTCGLLCDESRYQAAYTLLNSAPPASDQIILNPIVEEQPDPRTTNLVDILCHLSTTLAEIGLKPLRLHDHDTSFALYRVCLFFQTTRMDHVDHTLLPIIADSFMGSILLNQVNISLD
jgi:hypothetical protein